MRIQYFSAILLVSIVAPWSPLPATAQSEPLQSDSARSKSPGAERVTQSDPSFESLFDGKTLAGWQGDRTIWSVEDGAITGRTTADTHLKENNFLIWKDPVEDFELRLKFRLQGGNSGIYYRAQAARWRD